MPVMRLLVVHAFATVRKKLAQTCAGSGLLHESCGQTRIGTEKMSFSPCPPSRHFSLPPAPPILLYPAPSSLPPALPTNFLAIHAILPSFTLPRRLTPGRGGALVSRGAFSSLQNIVQEPPGPTGSRTPESESAPKEIRVRTSVGWIGARGGSSGARPRAARDGARDGAEGEGLPGLLRSPGVLRDQRRGEGASWTFLPTPLSFC